MVVVRAVASLLALFPVGVHAQSFCKVDHFIYVPGQAVETTMKTVVASVKRTSAVPGAQPWNWCNLHFQSNNPFYKPIEVTKKPAMGEVAHGSYSIRYRSNKAGKDSFVFMLHQSDARTNAVRATPVTVRVEVVEAPF